MQFLLKISRAIDWLNERVGRLTIWLILASTVISGVNAIIRKAFNYSSNAYLEVQWYLFAWAFLLAAGYTLLHQEHVKIDVIYSRLSQRKQLAIDILGYAVFLTAFCLVVLYYTWPLVVQKIDTGEMSNNAGGLIRWPVWLSIPIGFTLLLLQGWSELIKRIAFIKGLIPDPRGKRGEKTPEEELAESLRLQTEKEAAASAQR